MPRFNVGQRVRIVNPNSTVFGKEGTVYDGPLYDVYVSTRFGAVFCPIVYKVDIDGMGILTLHGRYWAFQPEHLRPLDPRCSEFVSDMERFAKISKFIKKGSRA